jgi:uncharacterized protein YndB with AHSA1/START domain
MSVEPIAPYLQPLRLSIRVERPVAEAFEVFTAGFGRWWPLATYSISQEKAVTCGIEPAVGGAVYEVNDRGEKIPWGHVLVWDPPGRLVLFWHPYRGPETGQEVEIRFQPDGKGTRVELEHRDWQKVGDDAERSHGAYSQGWPGVLEKYAGECRK